MCSLFLTEAHAAPIIIGSSRQNLPAPQFPFVEVDPIAGVSVNISSLPARPGNGALAASRDGTFYSVRANTLVTVDVHTNAAVTVGAVDALIDGLDIMSDGRAFGTASAPQPQLYSVDLKTGGILAATQPGAITDAIVAAGGQFTEAPFVGGLGSIGKTLYAVETRTSTLLSLNPDTGAVSVVGGRANLLASGTLSNGLPRSRYSNFAALTGVDLDVDGEFDTLIGGVSFFDDDGDAGTPTVFIGGVAKFDITSGQWDLIGTNPGVVFTSFTSVPVPEPAALGPGLLALSALVSRRRRGIGAVAAKGGRRAKTIA